MAPDVTYAGPLYLPRESYTSQEIFDQEIRKILHRQWLLVGHANTIRNPGDYFVRQVGPESMIFARDKAGNVRAYFNVCRHRGSQMLENGTKGCAEGIVCPYHKWTYDMNGALRQAPGTKKGQDFNFEEFPLFEAQVGLWEGWLFVWLGEETAPPIESELGPLSDRGALRAAGSHKLKLAHREEYFVDANWKSMMENDLECYHCARGGHPSLTLALNPQAYYLDLENGETNNQAFPLRPGFATLSVDGQRVSKVPLTNESADGVSAGFLHWPMFCGVGILADHAFTLDLTPLSVDRSLFVGEWYVHEDAVEGVDYDPKKVAEIFHITNLEDVAFGERNYRGVLSSRFKPGPIHPHREASVITAYERYKEMMAAD